jgi:hypothetical protein
VRLRRILSACLLAVLAVTGLTACQSKVGQAASVDSQQLSDSDLSGYIQPGTTPYNDPNSGTQVVPKLFVVENWVRNALVAAAIKAKGGEPTSAELNAARAALLGRSSIDQAEQAYTKLGYTKKFGDLIVDQSALLVVLIQRIAPGISTSQAISVLQNGQAGSQLIKAINAAKAKIDVSRRYGNWDAKSLSVTGSGAPDFVDFGTSASGTTSG